MGRSALICLIDCATAQERFYQNSHFNCCSPQVDSKTAKNRNFTHHVIPARIQQGINNDSSYFREKDWPATATTTTTISALLLHQSANLRTHTRTKESPSPFLPPFPHRRDWSKQAHEDRANKTKYSWPLRRAYLDAKARMNVN